MELPFLNDFKRINVRQVRHFIDILKVISLQETNIFLFSTSKGVQSGNNTRSCCHDCSYVLERLKTSNRSFQPDCRCAQVYTLNIFYYISYKLHLFISMMTCINSGSMEPAMKRGDLLVVTNDPNEPLYVGDIIEFKVQKGEIPIMHRIIKVHQTYSIILFIQNRGLKKTL